MRRVLGMVATLGLGCSPPPPRVVLVLVDTLRADRLGLHGHPRPTSPALDAWAGESTVFEAARSPAPWTLPAARALLGAGSVEGFDPTDTLLTRLDGAGWHTVGILSNPNLSPEAGFGAGWDAVSLHPGADAAGQIARAMAALEDAPADTPGFLLVHLMDPHLPYTEGPAHRRLWAGEAPSARLQQGFTEPDLRAARLAGAPALTPAERDHISARYDQNVRAVDDAMAPLLAALRPTDTLLFTADHGEALGEGGRVGHGQDLSEPLVRVPLVVGGPGWPARRRPEAVGLDDVGATVLAIAGVAPPEGATGRDLRGPLPPRPARLSHTRVGPARIGVVEGDRKWSATATRVAHVDLAVDPDESHPRLAAWTPAEPAAWARAGGPPLDRIWALSLAPAVEGATQVAQPGLQAATLTHAGGITRVAWPPELRDPTPPRAAAVPGGWRVTAEGPLPRELWFHPGTPGTTPTAATLRLRLRGETVDGRGVAGVDLSEGWAPRWPGTPALGGDTEALRALGYLGPD